MKPVFNYLIGISNNTGKFIYKCFNIILIENILSDEVKQELDIRLKNLEEGKTQLYSWDEVKAHF